MHDVHYNRFFKVGFFFNISNCDVTSLYTHNYLSLSCFDAFIHDNKIKMTDESGEASSSTELFTTILHLCI